jgi:lysozyme
MSFEALLAALKRDEGLRLKPYLDTATPTRITIGYGRNLSDVGIVDQEAHDMLVRDAIKAERDAASLVTNWSALDGVRQNVLANMCFNLGKGGLAKFPKFLAAVNEQRWSDAVAEMTNSAWYGQVGMRAARLAHEMLTGQA